MIKYCWFKPDTAISMLLSPVTSFAFDNCSEKLLKLHCRGGYES